ncbi:MAG: PilZ domain-containing protein [Candidatus Aminicenantes bacterium]|nr:PilZ domain-containing protein [Candidatus Aminicenantes bacterium]
MDQRKHPRFKTKMAVEVNDRQGLLENVSKEGVRVKLMANSIPKNTNVNVAFKVNGYSFKLKGIVRWCRRDKFSFQDCKELGLLLEEPPDHYHQFVETLSSEGVPAAFV